MTGREAASSSWRIVATDGVREVSPDAPTPTRWVWADTAASYPAILAAGERVARAWDVRLARRILRHSPLSPASVPWTATDRWDLAPTVADSGEALFAFDEVPAFGLDEVEAEWRAQRAAIAASRDPGRLMLLVTAESAGALVAAEMHAAGLPWHRATHERILVDTLGRRPAAGGAPDRMREVGERVRAALGDASLSLDSPPRVLRALHRAGLTVGSTSKWELAHIEHPVVEPLLEYKKLARLYTANGWAWLDEWVRADRFRPVYVPAGVVTGRWASSGGGALQIPRQLRPAVRPDPGWVIVDADVAQLEPRVLAAMARDTRMAEAARGRDLYEGIVATGAVATREEAKYAMLGAMYGATTGDSGRLVPRLRQTFPTAMALVDAAAVAGEDGRGVATWLGRGTPDAEASWLALQARASEADVEPGVREGALRAARERGRFTRNFVVQGTAAEWALCWLAEIRRRLDALPSSAGALAAASGPVFADRAHLVFFLHDEVMVHAPGELADAVVQAVTEAAEAAGRLLFGTFPIDFPLDVEVIRHEPEDAGRPR
ncbi:DNA polymerase-1 [Microbacterium sp. SORGH_AS428]|uniref:bifunctional 3'-5' exonuclease/DNA polymerase n=1 Tax=Microbacterium sp. SORGH_AS_0428 TaxID=3041788 RepID=UPI00285BDE7D|nr:bifunctional 3'-5' exonuclease/DNA polymerase [Microbacterium sp. SORGH_AS_0428]MDR6198529.1 DNA polymerase-1 [Microbacterium sp. SORGH_AS_0428]